MFTVKRYGTYYYGETIFTGDSVKACLKYLKIIKSSNGYTLVRSGRAFKVTHSPYSKYTKHNKSFRIEG